MTEPTKQWTDSEIQGLYEKCRAIGTPQVSRTDDADLTLAGYPIRVAQNSTLPEFVHFIRTGMPVNPVKITPAEMAVLHGGSLGDLSDSLGYLEDNQAAMTRTIQRAANTIMAFYMS